MTVFTLVVQLEVLFFLASKVAISALCLFGLDNFRENISKNKGLGNEYSYDFFSLNNGVKSAGKP